MINSQLKSLT
jgi:CO dehydrogenase/acetyl-CoA synthase alpha subunit